MHEGVEALVGLFMPFVGEVEESMVVSSWVCPR